MDWEAIKETASQPLATKHKGMKAIERARHLSGISEMADNSLLGGVITPEEHKEIKGKARDLQLDNVFEAMADYCK